jgi:hypothetical protein
MINPPLSILFSFLFFLVAKQNNTVDCRVYICKYAQAIYKLRFLSITYQNLYLSDKPLEIISKSSCLYFIDHTITQLRSKLEQNI